MTSAGRNLPERHQLSRFVTREVSQAMQHQAGTVTGGIGVARQDGACRVNRSPARLA
jgi:hypothetical protein